MRLCLKKVMVIVKVSILTNQHQGLLLMKKKYYLFSNSATQHAATISKQVRFVRNTCPLVTASWQNLEYARFWLCHHFLIVSITYFILIPCRTVHKVV